MLLASGKSPIKKIAWMLEPDHSLNAESVKRVLNGLGSMLDEGGCVVEPIKVTAKKRAQNTPAIAGDLARGKFEVLPTREFRWDSMSEEDLCHYISCYTQISHTDLLIAPDSIKKKFLQAFRFKFLHSLGYKSKVPVLLINSNFTRFTDIKNILFPVIDPVKSEESFGELLKLAKLIDSSVTMLFRVQSDEHGQLPGTVPFFDPKTMLLANSRLKLLSEWVNRAKADGVKVGLTVDRLGNSFKDAVVICQQKKSYDLIALDPSYLESQDMDRELSVLTRETRCPLWITHPIGQSGYVSYLSRIQGQLVS